MDTVVTRGLFVLLLYLQCVFCQQIQLKSPCNLGSVQNSGINYIPQANVAQQIPNQQNVQQRPKQNQASDIISALHNIRLSQASGPTMQTISCASKQSNEQSGQPLTMLPAFSTNQVPPAYVDSSKIQPSFSFQFVPATPQTNAQQNPQVVLQNPVIPSSQTYYQTNSMLNPQPSLQSSTVIPVVSSQTNPVPSQPIVFTLQSPQTEIPLSQSLVQNQPAMVYTMQGQPSTQQGTPKQAKSANAPMDTQSMMSMLMSQLQSPNGNPNALTSVLPSLLNTKQEKSSSMKALLPLILNLLNEKRPNCCHCGCPTQQEPSIHSGYSNQKDYSSKNVEEQSSDLEKVAKDSKKTVESNVSEELSEEEDEYEDGDDEDVSDE